MFHLDRYRYHALFLGTRVGCTLLYTLALVIATVKRVEFIPHVDDDVIRSKLQPEVDELMLEENWNAGKESGRNTGGGGGGGGYGREEYIERKHPSINRMASLSNWPV